MNLSGATARRSRSVLMANAKVYLIGGGPGDPELLTLKAARLISEADVILYDQLVNPEVLRHARGDAELVFVGKIKGDHTFEQGEINELLFKLSERHRVVARLKGGDPLIFGRGGEEYEHLVRNGVECEIVPGITSAAASSAAFGLPLTDRRYASSVCFATGHASTDGLHTDFTKIHLRGKTLVIYMGLSTIGRIMADLATVEENRGMPVAIVEKASRPKQRIHFGTLETIADVAREQEVKSPALIVAGDVVAFARGLHAQDANWSDD
jgi:uroporphyrin-III C-methyltransferase